MLKKLQKILIEMFKENQRKESKDEHVSSMPSAEEKAKYFEPVKDT